MDFLTDPGFWFRAVAVVVVVLLLVQFARPRYSLRIIVDPGGVRDHSGLPKSQVASVIQFLEKEVSLQGRVVVLGVRYPKGYLKIRFRGTIAPGEQQKIRNFLISIL